MNIQPSYIMTDDSRPLRNALGKVFASSKLLLCIFHVMQAKWTWLLQAKNKIPINCRLKLLKTFRRILYSHSKNELDSALKIFNEEAEKFPRWKTHCSPYLKRIEEWCLVWRNNPKIGDNNTNNIAEASMKLLKDTIFERKKSINPVELILTLFEKVDQYLTTRLVDILSGRKPSSKKMKLSEDFYLSISSSKFIPLLALSENDSINKLAKNNFCFINLLILSK